MAFTEEVFKNKDKWYGAHTGAEYAASEVEAFGTKNNSWSKSNHYAPNSVVLEVEMDPSDKSAVSEPHEKSEK